MEQLNSKVADMQEELVLLQHRIEEILKNNDLDASCQNELALMVDQLTGNLQKLEKLTSATYQEVLANQTLAIEKCLEIPLCKTITDFCAHHHAATLFDLSPEQRSELACRLEQLVLLIDDYKETLFCAFKVISVDALSDCDRSKYQKYLRAFIVREDCYP
jgi:hypothetical protein